MELEWDMAEVLHQNSMVSFVAVVEPQPPRDTLVLVGPADHKLQRRLEQGRAVHNQEGWGEKRYRRKQAKYPRGHQPKQQNDWR